VKGLLGVLFIVAALFLISMAVENESGFKKAEVTVPFQDLTVESIANLIGDTTTVYSSNAEGKGLMLHKDSDTERAEGEAASFIEIYIPRDNEYSAVKISLIKGWRTSAIIVLYHVEEVKFEYCSDPMKTTATFLTDSGIKVKVRRDGADCSLED
jgi:hypothetical protein